MTISSANTVLFCLGMGLIVLIVPSSQASGENSSIHEPSYYGQAVPDLKAITTGEVYGPDYQPLFWGVSDKYRELSPSMEDPITSAEEVPITEESPVSLPEGWFEEHPGMQGPSGSQNVSGDSETVPSGTETELPTETVNEGHTPTDISAPPPSGEQEVTVTPGAPEVAPSGPDESGDGEDGGDSGGD